MSLSRRAFLTASGAAAIAVYTLGARTFVSAAQPNDPRAAWSNAGQHPDYRVRAMSYAILAPNPHNKQPWLAELVGDNEMRVYCQTDRLLVHTDPFSRQIMIGLGAFFELMRMAAEADGLSVSTKYFPEGRPVSTLDEKPIAQISFSPSSKRVDPLFAQVLKRRSTKIPYDMSKVLAPQTLEKLQISTAAIHKIRASSEEVLVSKIRALTWEAVQIEYATPATALESIEVMRIGRAEVAANPDGISLEGPFFEEIAPQADAVRQLFATPGSPQAQQYLDANRAPIDATPAYVWLVTNGNSRQDQLEAGRDWVRLNLAATAAGLGVHPQSAILQEYPEMDQLLRDIHSLLDVESGRIQMLGRIGYAAEVPPAPRWSVETRIKSA